MGAPVGRYSSRGFTWSFVTFCVFPSSMYLLQPASQVRQEPGRTALFARATHLNEPRSLNASTRSPSAMPREAMSAGFSSSVGLANCCTHFAALKCEWLEKRVRVCVNCSGYFSASGLPAYASLFSSQFGHACSQGFHAS